MATSKISPTVRMVIEPGRFDVEAMTTSSSSSLRQAHDFYPVSKSICY
jgi:hypothetical protein